MNPNKTTAADALKIEIAPETDIVQVLWAAKETLVAKCNLTHRCKIVPLSKTKHVLSILTAWVQDIAALLKHAWVTLGAAEMKRNQPINHAIFANPETCWDHSNAMLLLSVRAIDSAAQKIIALVLPIVIEMNENVIRSEIKDTLAIDSNCQTLRNTLEHCLFIKVALVYKNIK
jgi:hypothetical protein